MVPFKGYVTLQSRAFPLTRVEETRTCEIFSDLINFQIFNQFPQLAPVSISIEERERERDILKASVVFGLWWLHLKLHPQSSTHDEITDQIEGDQSTE